jgi:hypothetical protein
VDGEIVGETQTQRVFTVMKKHGDRLACIVEDLLVISRMESGQADALRLEDFDFNVCATDVIHRLTPVIQNGQALVNFAQTPGETPMVFGDRFYWDQVLFNLVGNALKENQSSAVKVTVHLRQEADTSVIEVRDNGVGIPHADLPFVFKRFQESAFPAAGTAGYDNKIIFNQLISFTVFLNADFTLFVLDTGRELFNREFFIPEAIYIKKNNLFIQRPTFFSLIGMPVAAWPRHACYDLHK